MQTNIELVNFTNMTLEQNKMILSWRNNINIKKWMYSQGDITINAHLSFIESLKNTDSKLYFLVKRGDDNIGVIDFYDIDRVNKELKFGLYSNPNISIPGVGRILERLSIEYAFNTLKMKTLKLEVFSENIQVVNLHKKFKFEITSTKFINDKKVICMELKNENR